jgi:low temperature requirement protein LtrA
MTSRDPHEAHRASTPLELLFDLCFVGAVAQAAAHLHHGIAAGHAAASITSYAMVFFAIWWAWMNFTWFASAYDVDDVPYRLKVLLQIAGGLLLAAGVPRAFEQGDWRWVTFGYTTMRVGLIAGWMRAAVCERGGARATALRYAGGVAVCQIGWLGMLALPDGWWKVAWPVMVVSELLVPPWAERTGATKWHPEHVAERYGLFTLIVLGESVLGATVALQTAFETGTITAPLVTLVSGGVLVLFSMWWIYFDQPAHRLLSSSRAAFLWGYGHLFVFASTAAVGAGLGVAGDALGGDPHLHIPVAAVGAAVAVPVAVFLLTVWALQLRLLQGGRATSVAFLLAIPIIVAASFSRAAVLIIGLVLLLLVAQMALSGSRARSA